MINKMHGEEIVDRKCDNVLMVPRCVLRLDLVVCHVLLKDRLAKARQFHVTSPQYFVLRW
jgi:hypothetical protein